MVLPSYISIPEAAKKIHADEKDLRPLIEKGKIKAVAINGEIFVDPQTLPKKIVKKQDVPEYKKFRHLAGVGISLRGASRNYQIPSTTIQQWKERGLLTLIGTVGNKILVDEQDVAYCAYIYHRRKEMSDDLQGKWLFNDDGTPFSPNLSRRRHIGATA